MDRENKIAIVDLGSNSARLTIWGITAAGVYRIVDKARVMARMSAGMRGGMLSPDGIARALDALRWFRQLMDAYGVGQVYALATAAVRMAQNQPEFLRLAREVLRCDLRVISGEEEAYLDYLGVVNTLPVTDCVIIDTGGASTELIFVRDRKYIAACSLPFGAVLLTESFIIDEETPERIRAMDDRVDGALSELPWLPQADGFPVVGLGGSNRTLSHMAQSRLAPKRPYAPTHYHRIPASDVLSLIDSVLEAPPASRPAMEGVDPVRADILVGGFAPLKMLIRRIRASELIISACGLREGIFYRDIAPDAVDGRVEDVLTASALNFLGRLGQNIPHCRLIDHITGRMFAQLSANLALKPEHARLLHAAALLHDVGRVLSYDAHEIHGQQMILQAELFGLDHRERVLVSMIVGLHRARIYRPDFEAYARILSSADRIAIYRLAALLRVAEQLDRGQMGCIRDVTCRIKSQAITMRPVAEGDLSMQIASARLEADFFQNATGCALVVMDAVGER